jgi:hypothetical protein
VACHSARDRGLRYGGTQQAGSEDGEAFNHVVG